MVADCRWPAVAVPGEAIEKGKPNRAVEGFGGHRGCWCRARWPVTAPEGRRDSELMPVGGCRRRLWRQRRTNGRAAKTGEGGGGIGHQEEGPAVAKRSPTTLVVRSEAVRSQPTDR